MIDLDIVPDAMEFRFKDFGSFQRPYTGAEVTRVDRAGGKFAAQISLPIMTPAVGRSVVAKLMRAKQEGVRIAIPLLGISQGIEGTPTVDGSGQSGTTLDITGLQAGFTAREGYWFNVVSGTRHYLHNIAATARADSSGDLSVTIFPALRTSFTDGDTVKFEKPMIEGFVEGDEQAWAYEAERMISIGFSVEEFG
ncbi:MAG: hypothetical protein ABJC88_17035 [Parasphingorhabdus sp.]|uniref:hypothetical protein n=1 Tax=Sphingomonadales TaxID=204457 RepID=UPI0032649C6B